MGQRLSDKSKILTRLVTMLRYKHADKKLATGPLEILARLSALGITSEKPDEEIETALEKLVEAGDFVRD